MIAGYFKEGNSCLQSHAHSSAASTASATASDDEGKLRAGTAVLERTPSAENTTLD